MLLGPQNLLRGVHFAKPTIVAVIASVFAVQAYHQPNFVFRARNRSLNKMKDNGIVHDDAPDEKQTNKHLIDQEKKDARFWNNIAERYSKSPIDDEESYQKKLAMTQKYFHPNVTSVLEFGCGTGSTALIHSPYVKNIYAIDVSSKMIDIAKEKAAKQNITNVKFETMGIDRLDVPDGTYDVVLGMSILHLLPNKEEAISKVYKILKPGGLFISSTACLGDSMCFLKYIGPVGAYFGLLPKLNVFTATELKDDLTKGGFEVESEFQPKKDKAIFIIAKKGK